VICDFALDWRLLISDLLVNRKWMIERGVARGSQIANRQSPIANHQSPIANRQSTINQRSQITNHQSIWSLT
jgi:hypothetical protein